MANAITKKLKINTPSGEKEITLYDDYKTFSDYDNGNYIAVQTDTNKTGYVYCNSTLPYNTNDHFATFVDKNGNLRYAYTQEKLVAVYTVTTGRNKLPKINGTLLTSASNKYRYSVKDTDNGDGTTTRRLYSNEIINTLAFGSGATALGKGILSIDYIDVSNINSIKDMFKNCRDLKSVNLSNFNELKVTDMSEMFYGCSSLTSLDVSKLNMSNVTNISHMFSGCRSLTSLDLSNFDTSRVTDMSRIFYDCKLLTSLDLRN